MVINPNPAARAPAPGESHTEPGAPVPVSRQDRTTVRPVVIRQPDPILSFINMKVLPRQRASEYFGSPHTSSMFNGIVPQMSQSP